MLGWQAIFIPSRVFPNSAARIGFLAATAGGLRQPPKAPPLELCGADLPVTIFSALVTDDI
jgi:hypothetical protein